ncbi:PH domain-containing protein [Bacillus xiapuensis]|uniref:PH domain-containing protein n=1 Tax=Bacillus xiapuensis TaxID=2014075 RepID=UPI0012FE7D1A|nr:PH domain-containing protein [Bacillus xiapuensis]
MGAIHLLAVFILIIVPIARAEEFSFILIITLIVPGIISLLMWFRTGYKITNDELVIIYGPIKFRIDVHKIQTINHMKSPFVGPALSVDRIGITHSGFKFITISPKDKEKFIKAVLKINSNIKINK